MRALSALKYRPSGRPGFRVLVVALVIAVLGAGAALVGGGAFAQGPRKVPQDPGVESELGIRVDRAAVVADGGIVLIRYTVLDNQKASRFQNDVHHPPVLHSEQHGGDIYRTALMRQGHDLRPGQSYYVLYLNNKGAVRRGDTITMDTPGKHRLLHIPVQ
jgi:hypothetical protein